MTRIKFCGLTRACEIAAANELRPEYVGFVFAPKSRRYIAPEKARELKQLLAKGIQAVGVFADESPETVAALLNSGVIDLAQLHGHEGGDYIRRLRALSHKPVIQAFRIGNRQDAAAAEESAADYILLDSGAGTGTVFDWKLIEKIKRPYFLAGGLSAENVEEAIASLHPYAVDVSSGIERDGKKEKGKMADFTAAVRKEHLL